MGLVRSVTKRVMRTEASPDRIGSVRKQISMPVALLSTTNPLTNVCDLKDMQKGRPDVDEITTPSTPTRSSLDEDSTASVASLASTPATSVGEASPDREHKHDVNYFPEILVQDVLEIPEADTPPCIPMRALSHSKRAHEQLARKRSMQFSRPPSDQSIKEFRHNSGTVEDDRDKVSSVSQKSKAPDFLEPFSKELEQLNEIAEQFGVAARSAAIEEDLTVLTSRGLKKFAAIDYVAEIQSLWEAAFVEQPASTCGPWI